MSPERRVRVQSGRRNTRTLPAEPDALLRSLASRVIDGTREGLPRPALLAIEEQRVTQYDLPALISREGSLDSPIIPAIAGQPEIECLVLVGTFRRRSKSSREGVPVVLVFIEWPDNSWCMAWQSVDTNRKFVGDEPEFQHAIDGWPRPSGLGGWFSRARRSNLRLRIRRSASEPRIH